jgi:hypothetical protein
VSLCAIDASQCTRCITSISVIFDIIKASGGSRNKYVLAYSVLQCESLLVIRSCEINSRIMQTRLIVSLIGIDSYWAMT